MDIKTETDKGKVSFEVALNRTGFGLYSYVLTCCAGFAIISYACVVYGTSIIIPTSACELKTTTAQQGFLATSPLVGIILGATTWGYVGDVYGRRTPLAISLLLASLVNALASISVNWIMLMVLQLLAAFLASGQYSLSITLLSESVPMAKRNVLVLLVSSVTILCQGLMAAIAMPIIPLTYSNYLPSLGIYWNSWRTVMIVYSTPSLITAIWLMFMKESPKYLFNKGRESEAIDVLTTIHRVNNRWSSEAFIVTGISEDPTQKPSTNQQIAPLFKLPLLKTTVIMTSLYIFQIIGSFLLWLPTIANQLFRILETGEGNDLSICEILDASSNAPSEPALVPCALNIRALSMVLAVSVIQTIFNIFISTVVNGVGRRNLVICVAGFCGICGLVSNMVPNAIGSVVLFIVFLNGFVVMGLYTAIVVAVFPTSMRALAVAFTTTGGRVGSFASIQVLNLLLAHNCNAGFYLFASIFTSSALIALFLADDRHSPNIQQQAVLQDNSKTNN